MGAPCRWLPSPSLPPPPRSPSPPRPVAPLRRRNWSSALGLVGRWVGFRPLPPAHVRPPPARIRTLWGDPRVSSPSGPLPSLGVESSHDDSTPLPFVCGVDSSCHDSTLPPPRGGRVGRGARRRECHLRDCRWGGGVGPPCSSGSGHRGRRKREMNRRQQGGATPYWTRGRKRERRNTPR